MIAGRIVIEASDLRESNGAAETLGRRGREGDGSAHYAPESIILAALVAVTRLSSLASRDIEYRFGSNASLVRKLTKSRLEN